MALDPLAALSGALQQAEQATTDARKAAEEHALSARCENLEKKLLSQKKTHEKERASALRTSEEEHRRQMAELSKDAGRAVKTLQAVQTRLSLGAATAPSAVKKTVSKTPARASRKRLCYSSDEEPKLSVPVKRPKIALNSDSGDDEKPQLRGKTAKAGQRPKQTEKAGAAHSVSMSRIFAVRPPSVDDVPLKDDDDNDPIETMEMADKNVLPQSA